MRMEKLIHINLGTERNADACPSDGDSGKNFLTSRTFKVRFNIQLPWECEPKELQDQRF